MTLPDAVRRLLAVRAQVDPQHRPTLCAVDLARVAFLEAFLGCRDHQASPWDLADGLGPARAPLLLGLCGYLEQARRSRLHQDGIGLIRAAQGALDLLDPDPVWAVADYSTDFPLDAVPARR